MRNAVGALYVESSSKVTFVAKLTASVITCPVYKVFLIKHLKVLNHRISPKEFANKTEDATSKATFSGAPCGVGVCEPRDPRGADT